MANRVEVGEIVENATGLNITGASVTIKYHGGANAPVYDAENGGALVTQPLSTTNGKIGADFPNGAWVAANTDYDFLVSFGGDTLTFFWPGTRGIQFATTLPAGAGTSAPEDGELAMQLYDGTNKAAWLWRYRAATTAWDMIGGPPPAGGSLPGTPVSRQEFYLTGGSPTIQHMRYNGSSWDFVGTPPTSPVTGSPLNVLDVGQANNVRMGRVLALADFTTLCALPSTPVGLWNLTTKTSNLGTGGALVNKGVVIDGAGIDGQSTSAAQFAGAVAQALYTVDTGASDPFRIRHGSWGCWYKTARRGSDQYMMSKYLTTGNQRGFILHIAGGNVAEAMISTNGTSLVTTNGTIDVCDDRWHFGVATFNGTELRLYTDGTLENTTFLTNGTIFAGTAPFNIGGAQADAGTNCIQPFYGRVDEAFVTPDVLTEDQIRLLMASKIPHGYTTTPVRAQLNVRRKRRGAALVSGDFPAQPKRLHSFVAGVLTDAGSDNQTLTNNNAAVAGSGPDGKTLDGFNFDGVNQTLSSTDTGLPSGTSDRSMGCWIKTDTIAAMYFISYGAANAIGVGTSATGFIITTDGVTNYNGSFVADGQWHFVVVVFDNNAVIDGMKTRIYCDARQVGNGTTFGGTTLVGANGFKLGALAAGNFWQGQISRAFVTTTLLTQEQIAVLFQKSSQTLPTSPKAEQQNVEAFDATNVYTVNDDIDSNWAIDLSVAS